jgi:hypothetical protein
VLAACGDEPVAPEDEHVPPDDVPEFTIQYIQRLPEMEWVRGSDDPTRDGWPAVGQEVRWRVHVRSWAEESYDVPYRWEMDGAPVASGELTIPPGAVATTEYPWSWTFDRHLLRFVLDPGNAVEEELESNNALEVHTDALSVAFFVEQRFYDFYRAHVDEVSAVMDSFEDWIQFHVQRANLMFASARYPETPDGVLDRWRIDRIVVVPNGTGGAGGWGYDDRTVDLIWGFGAAQVDLLGSSSRGYSPTFGYNGTVLHELGHARGLLDVYRWNLLHDLQGTFVDLREDGEPVLGTDLFPGLGTITLNGDEGWYVYSTPEQGLMNDEYNYVDRYSAIVLNRMAGARARFGNHNCPLDCGLSRADLPGENRLVVTDEGGTPLAGAEVRVFQSETLPYDPADPSGSYEHYFDPEPDLELVADADGAVLLGRNPFGSYEETRPPGDPRSGVEIPRWHVILRVEHEGRIGYGVLESRLFNLEYWRGHDDLGEHEIAVTLHDPE